MKNRISFLLGSGISIPAGMPSVFDITRTVLCGTVETDEDSIEMIERVVPFLKILRNEIDRYYILKCIPQREVNYEDLYYVASQIHDNETGNYDNPVVQAFTDKIFPDIKSLLENHPKPLSNKEWCLRDLAEEAMNYIKGIVGRSLRKEPNGLESLNCIRDACLSEDISSVDIFTLNHDTLIEKLLECYNIEYTNGFGPRKHVERYAVRAWSPEEFDNDKYKVRLLKLHGSIDWHYLSNRIEGEPTDIGKQDEPMFVPTSYPATPPGEVVTILERYNTIRNQDSKVSYDLASDSLFLTGTFNKMLKYGNGIYLDLHSQMHRALRQAEILIISGYGFGDKGINTRLVQWASSSEQKLLIVIHGKPDDVYKNARAAIGKNWRQWTRSGKLVFIKKWIESTSWENIRDVL